MPNPPLLLWLHDPQATDATLVGPKSARLATMQQGGLPVPPAFVLTIHAFREGMSEALRPALLAAYEELGAARLPVAVRSSATAEDLAGASFAGLQETVLNVVGEEALLAAVQRVWASLESPEARAYRERAEIHDSAMAVLVQRQVAATVAGIAFGRDPITAEAVTIIEAVAGLGDALASGEAEPQRWRLAPGRTLLAPADPLLDQETLAELLRLIEQAAATFGEPQDVEWAFDGERLWMLQSRAITTRREDWFTSHLPEDPYLWTAAFLNERFTQPVSPLGWSLVARPLERLALRAPLELLGAEQLEGPLLKLWRGHPYSRVEAWQRLYKLFPDTLLPEDAERYFPGGDISLRRAPRYPTFGPHLVWHGLRVLRENFAATSPLHNPAAWARYEQRQAAALIRFSFEERELARRSNPIPAARALLQQVADLTDELLELHRWSLLYADLSFSLLRRLLILTYGATEGPARAVALTANVESPTTQMNHALEVLAAQVSQSETLRWSVQAVAEGRGGQEAESEEVAAFNEAVRRFLETYGHRFFSLDLYDAPWEADIPAFARLLLTLAQQEGVGNGAAKQITAEPPAWARPFVRLTREYLKMRESQRFHWQQLLALQRRVALWMGACWVTRGQLSEIDDVFALTWEELMTEEPERERTTRRMARLRRLRAQALQAPGWHYPDFLRGNTPLRPRLEGAELTGRPVSPGVARGPARLIAHPGDFERLVPGDILVTSSPDPGWTPVFSTVAGMVTERGGQLSHGAVVAREYRLPAVSGIAGAMHLLREGELLLVDGTQGIVLRLEEQAHTD